MKLYSFEFQGKKRIGAERSGTLVDLQAADPALPSDMLDFLRRGESALRKAEVAVAEAKEDATRKMTEITLLAPVPRPGKILCSGINYRGHLEEEPGATLPEEPFFFSKLPSCVVGPGQPIVHPRGTKQMDYEVELAVVIGRKMRNTPESEVMAGIAGYTIFHDVSARDVQLKDHQITLGKNFDTFAPMGPCIVTREEIPDPGRLKLRTYLNGKIMQDACTTDWVFPLTFLLSTLTHVMTLEPGDVVTTGCPAGVGAFRIPPVFLQPGDEVVLEIEGIGRLANRVVAEEMSAVNA
jgi:2-keto-4-pentenoate hydratase/2-oxohepta-3-ene-1,7-dioic acid hydratase in catechol pathway